MIDYNQLKEHIVSPKWQKRSVSELYINAITSMVNQASDANTFGNTTFIGDIQDNLDLSDGGTESNVSKSDSSFKQVAPYTYKSKSYSHVNKDNNDLLDNFLEQEVSNLVSNLGFSVAKIELQNGRLQIENLGLANRYDVVLEGLYSLSFADIYMASTLSEKEKIQEDYMNKFYQKGLDLSVLGANADGKLDVALNTSSNKDNSDLADLLLMQQNHRVYKKFNSTFTKKDEYLVNMLEMLPNADEKLISSLEPLTELLIKGFEKYASWSLDIKPKNEFYKNADAELSNNLKDSSDRGKILLNDFNRVKYMSMQEADALIIDSYIPSHIVASPLTGSILPVLTPLGPLLNPFREDQKQGLIDARINVRNELGANIDALDYKKYLTSARAYQAIRNLGYAMKRLSNTDNFKDVVVNYFDFYHNYSMFQSCMQELGMEQHNDYKYFNPLLNNVRSLTAKNLNNAIPSSILEAAMDFENEDFSYSIQKYEDKLQLELSMKSEVMFN